jgi:hypothetical protein
MKKRPDWGELNGLTAGYDYEQCGAGEDQAVFCRLHLKLSDVKARVSAALGGPSKRVPFLYIFADTLVIDEPFLPSPSTTIVARALTIEGGTPLVAPDPRTGAGGVCAIQILTQQVEGGPLQLTTDGTEPSRAQLDGAAPESIRFVTGEPLRQSKGALELLDLLRHPIAWNGLKAGFAAAAILSERDGEEKKASIAILRWIYQCCALIGSEDGPFQREAADLSYQSSSLMVLTGTEGGPPYVPVLSQGFYAERIAGLLTVVQSYEQKIDQLDTRSDIKQAVQAIASAIKDVAAEEIKPIKVAIGNTESELKSLQKQYDTLMWQFVLQSRDVGFKRVVFQNALEEKLFWDKVKVAFDLIQAVVGMAVAVGSIVAAPEATVGLAGAAMKTADGAISLLSKALEAGASLEDAMRGAFAKLKVAAEQLKKFQESLADLNKSGKALYEAAQKAQSTLPKTGEPPQLAAPAWAEIATMDPAMEWNLFANAVEASMKKHVDEKIGGADKYLLSLKALVEYGKAINGKAVAIAQLQARSLELQAQKAAAEMAEQRWRSLEAESVGDLQKKAALKALLLQRSITAKRALLIGVRAFRAAYQYRWLKDPGLRISLEMNYVELNKRLVDIKEELEKLLTSAPPDQRFDTEFVTLPVRRAGQPETQDAGGSYALLTPKSKEGPSEATLSWSVPIETPYFLPDDGNIAFFIEEGWFYLDGAKPNKQGRVWLKIGASGQFSNGYGRFGADRHFVSAPAETQAMDFIYAQGRDGKQSDPSAGGAGTPWKPAAVVKAFYMTPSPFTQWTVRIMDASALDDIVAIRVRLKGYFHRAELGAERPGWDKQEQHRTDGTACFRKLGVLAVGARPDVSLRLPEQEDKAFMWKAPSVHPLQVLENNYQRIVRLAGERPGVDPVKAESEALSRFFIQDAGQAEPFKTFEPTDRPEGQHLAAVKMNHLIASFYLYRLLVQYRADAGKEISDDLRADLSGDLTKLLHNGDRAKMNWLSDWLTKKIAELGEKIDERNARGKKKRFIFFLKGGRALNYFLDTPEKGENDWDTQVVIDPSLPADEWYQCFAEIHDVLLAALKTFKVEFTELVQKNCAPFAEYLRDKAGPQAGEDEEADENEANDIRSNTDHASCKAELIDIGLPRRDSASALEEWRRLSAANALLKSQGVVYPHREYYLNEYLMMIRDAFLPDAEVRKAPKRILRLGLILKSDRGRDGAPSPAEAKRLSALPNTAKTVAALGDKGRKELFGVIFTQFVEAYNLLQDPELAAYFDQKCVSLIQTPPKLPKGLAELLDDGQKITAGDIGIAHELSTLMDNHWKSRNDFFEESERLRFFTGFVRDLSRATRKGLKDVDAQFAVAGSYAARLHSGRLRIAPSGLEPIRRILVKLQCAQGCNRAEVMGAVRDTIGKAADATNKFTVTEVAEEDKQSLLLYWKEKTAIGDFTYAPLVMKIRVAEQKGSQLPVLASIDGIPVLDLRYLVADYRSKTSKIDERGSRRVLASATAAVSEMLSKFDFDSDDAE